MEPGYVSVGTCSFNSDQDAATHRKEGVMSHESRIGEESYAGRHLDFVSFPAEGQSQNEN
jgi:hypothetical protein